MIGYIKKQDIIFSLLFLVYISSGSGLHVTVAGTRYRTEYKCIPVCMVCSQQEEHIGVERNVKHIYGENNGLELRNVK